MHLSKETQWVEYTIENVCVSTGCAPPQKPSRFIIKRNARCLFSDYKIQRLTSKRDSYCAAYFLRIKYPVKVLGIDLKSAVLNLYYQMIQ